MSSRKVHKPPLYPLREIVDSTGAATKRIDKMISRILKQYVKQTEHYIKNSKDFVNQMKDVKIAEDETIVSYDVTALYPSIPQEEAIAIFHQEMIKDKNIMINLTKTKHLVNLNGMKNENIITNLTKPEILPCDSRGCSYGVWLPPDS